MTPGASFTSCRDHVGLISAMAEAYPPHEMTDAAAEAYLLALYDVPLPYCAAAAVELIRRGRHTFLPTHGEWKSVAAELWNRELRQQQNERLRLSLAPSTAAERAETRREFHKLVLERASEGDEFFQSVVNTLQRGKLLKRPMPSIGDRLEEIDAELDCELREKVARMTPQALEARRLAIERTHGPNCGGASVSKVLYFCDGCGKSMQPGTEAWRGMAPGTQGEAALCEGCKPLYSWSRVSDG